LGACAGWLGWAGPTSFFPKKGVWLVLGLAICIPNWLYGIQIMDVYLLKRQLSEAGRLFERQLCTLMEREPFVRGGVYRLRRKCGKAGCRCARGAWHESWVFRMREHGVQRLCAVPSGELGRWRAWVHDYRRFRLARRELARQYREILRLIALLEDARALAPPASGKRKGN
jgi:hypothetical protein